MRKVFLIVLGLIFLVGCASYGNKQITDDNKVSQIVIGQSTKAEVRAVVGAPNKVTLTDNDEEIWEYTYLRYQTRASTFVPVVGLFTGGADTSTKTLTVRFTTTGIVKSIGRGQSSGGGGGLLD